MKLLINIALGFIAVYVLSEIFTGLGFGPKTIVLLPLDHKFGEFSTLAEVRYGGIIRLTSKTGSCSGWVIDRHFAVTAAHCLNDKGYILQEGLHVYSDGGSDTEIIAKAMGYDSLMDMGLIEADFSTFKPVPTNFYSEGFPRNGDPRYFTFGFPLGQKFVSFSDFTPHHMDGFYLAGIGHIIPGMSGGPVLNSEGVAVGINSAVNGQWFLIAPIQGFLGRFRLE